LSFYGCCLDFFIPGLKMEGFEYSGIWWLPENPEGRAAGTLKYDPKEGSQLDLIGTFKEPKDLNIFWKPKIILGLTSNGKYITLYKCFETKFNINFPGFSNSSFLVSMVIVGCHFKKEEDILFNSLSIGYSNLDEWAGISGFRQKTEFDQKGHLNKFDVLYEPPQNIEANLGKYKLHVTFNLNAKSDFFNEFNLKQTTLFRLESTTPVNITDYLDEIAAYARDFLSLAIGKAIYPKIIIGKSNASSTKLPDGEIVLTDILIFYKLGPFVDFSKRILSHEMLFTFKDVSDNFELFLNNWLSKSELLQPVYELYFGTLYNPLMYLNHQFLSLAQALESYHRRKFEGKYVSDDAYKEQYQSFLNAIHQDIKSDFRDSLHNKMKYLHEFSLRKRLEDIFDKYEKIVESIIPDKVTFIESVKSTRNFLTHYDKNLELKSKKGQDLYWLTQKMKCLLEICLLSELGIADEAIKAITSRNEKYKFLAQQKNSCVTNE
jgi:hypothetical protein